MRILHDQAAEQFSTFRLKQRLSTVIEVDDIRDLAGLDMEQIPIISGEGSNTIFLASQQKPLLRFTGKTKTLHWLTEQECLVHVEAGHNWHQLVSWAVEQGLWGIENLALIPGSVGAAPVQNIGAYGVELANVCQYVDFYYWQTKTVERLPAINCQFGYRDSIFKKQLADQGIILAVGIKLTKAAKPVLSYPGLDTLPADSSVADIYQRVIMTRQSKLPDCRELANCGSFFKNPVISAVQYQKLKQQYPAIPGFKLNDQWVKIPAAWLIDQQGFKGYRLDGVGCYVKQPLVIVNYGSGTAQALLALLGQIQDRVYQVYQIALEPEVRLLTEQGRHYVDCQK